MRIGKFVEHFKAAALAADSKSMDPVLKYLAVGRQLGYAFYLTFDAMTYIDQSGIRKFEGAAKLQKQAYKAWLAGLLCNIVAGVYTLYNMKYETPKTEESGADAEKAVEMKKLVRYGACRIEHWRHSQLILTTGRERLFNCSSSRIFATQLSLVALLATLTLMMVLLVWPERRAV